MIDCSSQMHRVEILRESLEQSVLNERPSQEAMVDVGGKNEESSTNNIDMNMGNNNNTDEAGMEVTSPPRPYYHHHRHRPLIMLFQSNQTAIIQVSGLPQKRPDIMTPTGNGLSRFSVSPTPNALPASTISSPSPHLFIAGGNTTKPLRVIVSNHVNNSLPAPLIGAADGGSASSPASSMDSGVALSPTPHDYDQHFFTSPDGQKSMSFNATDHPNPQHSSIGGDGVFRPRSMSECFSLRRMDAQDPPTPMVECTERRPPWLLVKDDTRFIIDDGKDSGRNGTLKGILKKSPGFSGGGSCLKGSGNNHFRRDANRFSLSRSLSESISVVGEEEKGVVVLNNAFNGMALNNLCETCEEEEEEAEAEAETEESHRPGSITLRMKKTHPYCASPTACAVISNGSDSSLNTTTDDLVETGSCESAGDDYMSAAQLQPRKKRVSFSEHVQARIYRSNSSILGQKRKNEKKNRIKRRRTESESSINTDDGNHQEKEEEHGEGESKDSSNATNQRRDSGIDTFLAGDDSDEQPLSPSDSSGSPPISPKRVKRLISADSAIGLGEKMSMSTDVEHLAVR